MWKSCFDVNSCLELAVKKKKKKRYWFRFDISTPQSVAAKSSDAFLEVKLFRRLLEGFLSRLYLTMTTEVL